jgi:seryl-tRNA synthetase
VDRALQMRAAASFFEQHDLSQLENARQRLSQKTDELRKEAQEIESAMRRLEAAMEAQTDRSSASGKAKLAETRSELRVLRKRRKRILQRLGEIPAQVRLGKRQPNGDDLS